MKTPNIFILTLICLLALGGVADVRADISNTAVLFLRIAPGARAAGMGEAFVAVADDATATHWNPAGLGAAPLSDTWMEVSPPSEFRPIKHVATVRKGGGKGFEGYDTWVHGGQGIVRYDGKKWHSAELFSTRTDQTVRELVSSYFNITDDARLEVIVARVGKANFGVTKEQVEKWRADILAALPSDYDKTERLTLTLDSLLFSYGECRIDANRIDRLQRQINEAMKDNKLSKDELEAIDLLSERARTRYMPEELEVPYAALFEGEVTSSAASGEMLVIGTSDGIWVMAGSRWRHYGGTEGLTGGTVTHLSRVGGDVLVGTSDGLFVFSGQSITPVAGTENGPMPKGDLEAVAASATNQIYVVVNHDLYFYNGEEWHNWFDYVVPSDTQPADLAERFALFGSSSERVAFTDKLLKINGVASATELNLAPGATVHIPYTAGLKGMTNGMLMKAEGGLLLATDYGVLEFTGDDWVVPGYKNFTVEEGQTLDDIVNLRTVSNEDDRLAYKEALRVINDLGENGLEGGMTVKVYKDPTSSPAHSVAAYELSYYVASDAGLLAYDGAKWSFARDEKLARSATSGFVDVGGDTWFVDDERIVARDHGRTELSLMHVNWLPELAEDLYYDFASGVFSLGRAGSVGISVSYISYGTIDRRDPFNNPLGTFDSYDAALAVSYGTALTKKLRGGISSKFIYSKLSDVGAGAEKGKGSSSGFAFDFGLLYHFNPRLNLGLALTNLGPKMSYIDAAQSDELPRNLALGFAYKMVQTEYTTLLVTGEANKILVGLDDGFGNELKETILNGGMEFTYADLFALRGGYIYDREGRIEAFTIGAGLQLFDIAKADFAYIPSQKSIALANTLRMSLTITP